VTFLKFETFDKISQSQGSKSMSSPTRRSEAKRKANHARSAKRRKNLSNKFGSTPKSLTLDKPNANEKASKKAG